MYIVYKSIIMDLINVITDTNLQTFKNEIFGKQLGRYATSKTFDALIESIWLESKKPKTSTTKLRAYITAKLHTVPFKKLVKFFETLHKLIPAISPKSDTLEKTMSHVRKIVIVNYGKESQQYKLSKDKMFYIEKQQKMAQKRAEMQIKHTSNILGVKLSTIERVINETKNSLDWNDRVIFVQLATGGRFIEVVKVSEYFEVKEQPTMIKVKGFTKNSPLNESKDNYIIKPTLYATSDEVISSVEFLRNKIRGLISEKDNIGITNTLSKTVMVRIKRRFGIKLKTHDMRKIYGNASYILYADKTQYSLTGWLNEKLGHSKTSLSTSLYYSAINIIDDRPVARIEAKEEKEFKEESKVAEIPDGSDIISLKTPNGAIVKFQKIKARGMTQAKKIEKLNLLIDILNEIRIKPTFAILKKLGFGSRIINLVKAGGALID